ncbi:alpha/beta hydrolase [Sphingomonas immobilis]|uniref:Alpha/beta hydrolase n=1 Tax=Sphingomonas immobilis TaxID=3063997 RepID=A0ABT9A006_9SPHN|nr:alpha/beta hydrolase [Sphingomonas sp. CA1-15]MDO7842331.1 alpha/beta hydrolase [Sphingomonas sp. CA1-15]
MTTRHLVDPALLPLLEMLPTRDLHAGTLMETRALMRERLGSAPLAAPDAVLHVPGADGAPAVAVRLFRPPGVASPSPAILHIHGGGFVIGAAAMNDAANAARAMRHGAVVVSVEYRLAPETPFPGPIEDCYAALAWLFAEAPALAIDPARIVVTGESAGGGLAAALALLARDRGLPPLAGQVLTYPMLDPASPDSANPSTGEFIWTRGSTRFGWEAMRGGRPIASENAGYFAPALATDLRGLAPAFIAVGALDLFLDEDVAYATRLSHAAVPVELHVYPGAFHGFDLVAHAAPALRMADDIAAATARFLGEYAVDSSCAGDVRVIN